MAAGGKDSGFASKSDALTVGNHLPHALALPRNKPLAVKAVKASSLPLPFETIYTPEKRHGT